MVCSIALTAYLIFCDLTTRKLIFNFHFSGSSGKMYGSGGFIANLGRNERDSLITLYELKEGHWLNHFTRVVFFEALFYNLHTNKFTIFIIICENFANGVYITKVKVSKLFYWLLKRASNHMYFISTVMKKNIIIIIF